MVLLFDHDGLDSRDRISIDSIEFLDLLLQVAENDPLNCSRCSGDCARTAESSNEAKRKTADAAEVVTAAAPNAAALKLGLKYGAVLALVRLKFSKLCQKIACREPRDQKLTGIDIHTTVLASVIDFEDSLSEAFSRTKTRDQLHEVQRRSSAAPLGVRWNDVLGVMALARYLPLTDGRSGTVQRVAV